MPTKKKARLKAKANTMKRYSAEADIAAERAVGMDQQVLNKASDRARKVDKIYERTVKKATGSYTPQKQKRDATKLQQRRAKAAARDTGPGRINKQRDR